MDGAAYGYANMGPYQGGQAEYLRIPYADFNLLKLSAGTQWENDFTMLSDIFPTGYHGTELAEVGPGDSVAVFGAGPVGLMAAHSAFLRGASQVFVADKQADRLQLAKQIDAVPIDISRGDPVEQIMEATQGRGVDCGVEAASVRLRWDGWCQCGVLALAPPCEGTVAAVNGLFDALPSDTAGRLRPAGALPIRHRGRPTRSKARQCQRDQGKAFRFTDRQVL